MESSSPKALLEQNIIRHAISSNPAPTSFQFLDLPKELRDKIYEGLLCPHIDGAHQDNFRRVRDYGLEPAILRTNRQIHKEASEVLYKQNRSAIITFDTEAWTIFEDRMKISEFFVAVPVVWLKNGKAGGMPMLTMDITVRSEHDTPSANEVANAGEANTRMVFIGFSSAVYVMCRKINLPGSADQLQLAVRLERPVGKSIQEELLDPFQEVRGIGRAIITGIPPSFPAELTTLMETPIAHTSEILARGKVYESRARRQMRAKKWNEARDTLENALGSLWDSRGFQHKLSGFDEEKAYEFHFMEVAVKSIYIECCIKVGRTLAAHKGLEELFLDIGLRSRGADYRLCVATTHYNFGVIFRDSGHLNAAAYSFLQALREVPGHQGADEAVDALEERVEGSADSDHVVVALNIKTTLNAFRHKTTAEISYQESESIVRGFIGTLGEMQSLFQAPSPALVTRRTFLMKAVL